MIRTELYCVTKNFYPLIFILGDNSYRRYKGNFEALADEMIIDPKHRVFVLEEDSIIDTLNDSLVEENMLDVGLKTSLKLDQITENPSKYEKHVPGSVPIKKVGTLDDVTLGTTELKKNILTSSAKLYVKNSTKLINSNLVKDSALGRTSPTFKQQKFKSTIEHLELSRKFSRESPRGPMTQRSLKESSFKFELLDKDTKSPLFKLQKLDQSAEEEKGVSESEEESLG